MTSINLSACKYEQLLAAPEFNTRKMDRFRYHRGDSSLSEELFVCFLLRLIGRAFTCRRIKFQIMRRKFAAVLRCRSFAPTNLSFALIWHLIFRGASAIRRWCVRSETLRSRIICREISSSTICLPCNSVLSHYRYNWPELPRLCKGARSASRFHLSRFFPELFFRYRRLCCVDCILKCRNIYEGHLVIAVNIEIYCSRAVRLDPR